VWFPRDTASLEERLGVRQLVAWAQDGVLHVLWRGEAGTGRDDGHVPGMGRRARQLVVAIAVAARARLAVRGQVRVSQRAVVSS
jgi:hypothetical protein